MIPNFEKITLFWCEVVDTIDTLMEETDEGQARMLLQHYEESLKVIDQNLTFHFERDEHSQRIEMIFGCDGYAQSIASVLSLVDAAPMIDGVQVVAFNGRQDPLPESVRLGDDEYGLDDFWFSYRITQGEFHLNIYVERVVDVEEDPAVEAVMILLDALLGEFDLMTRVSTLSWYDKPADPVDFGLMPLRQLRATFDNERGKVRLIGVTLH
ncbi:hypothetical protein [Motiliproteus sediminis]|uniref:hypothetical protein n=1 Tax=Motiliproteus sediminis TaxID=1468178 RepID=UPI001AEF85D2|nr:hypothetical protein [Motiliproteus sediminis]